MESFRINRPKTFLNKFVYLDAVVIKLCIFAEDRLHSAI